MKNMKISSVAFEEKGAIPAKYTCDGENINPPLMISEIPKKTESLVLIMDDPDIPDFVKASKNIEVFDHWVVFNIKITEGKGEWSENLVIEEGVESDGMKGVNSTGSLGYMGPCPPDGEHRYFFKVYALSSYINLPEGASKAQVEEAMENLVLDSAKVVGLYERN